MLSIREKMKENKAEYNELIRKRMCDMEKPSQEREMTEKQFRTEEARLNKIGIIMKMECGIKVVGEVAICRECDGWFVSGREIASCRIHINEGKRNVKESILEKEGALC